MPYHCHIAYKPISYLSVRDVSQDASPIPSCSYSEVRSRVRKKTGIILGSYLQYCRCPRASKDIESSGLHNAGESSVLR